MKRKTAIILSAAMVLSYGNIGFAKQEISGSIKVVDSSGNPIYDFSGLGEINGSVSLSKAADKNAEVFVAAYGTDNNLLSVREYPLAAGETTVDFSLTAEAASSLKAYVWSENQVPITNTIEVKKPEITSAEVRGIYQAGQPLRVSYSAYGITDEDIEKCNWYACTAIDGEYILMGTGMKYLTSNVVNQGPTAEDNINNIEVSKYFKAEIVLKNGESYFTEPVFIEKMYYDLNHFDYGEYESQISALRKTTNSDYKFTVGNQEFILLDSFTSSDTSRFKIMAEATYGKHSIENLNTTVLPQLDERIAAHIDMNANHIGSFTSDFRYVNIARGISMPSVRDLINYKDIVGLKTHNINDESQPVSFGTNSVSRFDRDANYEIGVNSDGTVEINKNCWSLSYDIAEARPVFYIDKDFFKDVKLDLSKAGAKVLETIRNEYSYNELLSCGYSQDELDMYYNTDGKSISGVAINGEMGYQCILNASCNTIGVDEAYVSYKWKISNTETGIFEEAADGDEFAPSTAQNGKFLKLTAYLPNGMSADSETVKIVTYTDFDGKIDTLAVRGIYEMGQPLSVGYTGTGVTDADIIGYKWLVSLSLDGEYSQAGTNSVLCTPNATSAEQLQNVEIGKYYKVEITLKNGDSYTSEPVYLEPMHWQDTFYHDNGDWKFDTTKLDNLRIATNSDYKFSVDGQEFVLLNTFGTSDTSRYKVIAENTYGKHIYPNGNAENNADFLVWIKALLPQKIVSHIDMNANFPGSFTGWSTYELYTRGIGVPSVKDITDYKDIIGVRTYNINDKSAPVMFGTNSMKTDIATAYRFGINSDGAAVYDTLCNAAINAAEEVRPEFYLDKDFFKTVKLDLDRTGVVIKNMLKTVYTTDELKAAGYTDEDIEKYFTNNGDKSISDAEILGDVGNGKTLHASCSSNGVNDNDIVYRWYVSDSENGEYIEVATGETFIPSLVYDKKYLKLAAELPTGERAYSVPIILNLLDSEFTGTIENLTVRGIFKAGQPLSFAYTSDTVTDSDFVSYTWYVSDSEDGAYTQCGTDKEYLTPNYTPDIEMSKYYKVSVKLKNGVTYSSEPIFVEKMLWSDYCFHNNGDYVFDTAQFNSFIEETNPDYKFTINGQDFILLDTFGNSDNSRYLVMAEYTYGKHNFSSLENVILPQLPERISNHIDMNANFTGSFASWMAFLFSMRGIGVPSVKDLLDYKDIIGYKTYNLDEYNTLEAPLPVMFGTNSLKEALLYEFGSNSDGEMLFTTECNGFGGDNSEVRPMFYLDKDFFTGLDMDEIGAGVKVIEMINAQ